MKTLRSFALFCLSVLALNGCAAELVPDTTEDGVSSFVEKEFTASLEEQTRTTFSNASGSTRWATGDRIQILGLNGITNTTATASNFNSDKTHASFKASVAAGEDLLAVYPTDLTASIVDSKVKLFVPSAQDGLFGSANIAVAKCDKGNFSFRNVTTVFQFIVDMVKYPGAQKVRVEPLTSSEKLVGPIYVDMSGSDPAVTTAGSGNLSVVADLSTSQGTSTKTAYISVIPRLYHGVKFFILDGSNTILRTVTYTGTLDCDPNKMYQFGDLSQHLDPYNFIDPETFTACNGTGGRDGSFALPTTELTSAAGKCDYDDWSLYGAFEGKQCLAVSGNGTSNGFAITPELGISTGWATFSFDIAAVTGASSLRYMLYIEGRGAIEKQRITMTRNWQNVKVYIQGADEYTKVRFETYNPTSAFFIDNVKVIDGAPAFNYLNLDTYETTIEAEDTELLIPGSTNVIISTSSAEFKAYMDSKQGLKMENIPANNTQNEKTYSVYLSSRSTDKVNDGNNTVIVHQRGKAKVFTTPEALNFTPAGGTLTAQIGYWNITPEVYDVVCSDSHFTVSRTGDQLTVTAPANTTTDPISAEITVTVADHSYERSFTLPVTQAAEPILTVTPASMDFVYTGGEYVGDIVTKNFAAGLTLVASSSNSAFKATLSGGKLKVVAPENTTSTAISSTITVTATDGTASKSVEVVVTVAGMPELTVTPATFELESSAASEQALSYSAKNFGGTPAVTVSLKNGEKFSVVSSGATLTVKAESDNTTGAVLKDTLVVTATLGDITRSVTVPFSQKFAVDEPADQTITFSAATATAYYGTPLTGMTVTGAQTTVTYSISFPAGQPACATIDAATGVVTPLAVNGTATVTATAAGTADYKTATASYTLTVKRLPAAYTETEYLEGDGTKYIDAGIQLLSSSRVVIDFAFTVSSTSENPGGYLYGALEANYTTKTDGSKQFAMNAAATGYVKYNTTRVELGNLGTSRHTIDQNANNVYMDGVSKGTFTAAEYSTPGNMYLFWTNIPGENTFAKARAKVYSCQVYWNGTTLSRDFVPCTSGTTAGMYDLVGRTFYPLQ